MRAATFFLCFSLKLNAVKKRKYELCFLDTMSESCHRQRNTSQIRREFLMQSQCMRNYFGNRKHRSNVSTF